MRFSNPSMLTQEILIGLQSELHFPLERSGVHEMHALQVITLQTSKAKVQNTHNDAWGGDTKTE
jgi:hypothetical protein